MQHASVTGARLLSLVRWAAFACLLAAPTSAHAFTYNITVHSKQLVGTSRHVNMAGTYSLSAGEQSLSLVRIVTLDSSGNLLSWATGSFTSSTWTTSIGDFALVYYYVEFRVRNNSGTTSIYKTPTYTW